MTPEILSHYVDRIYKAVLKPELINGILDDLRYVIESPYSAFQIENTQTQMLSQACLIAYDDTAINQYAGYYIGVDPWMDKGLATGELSESFMLGQRVLSDKEYYQTEFYQDWGRHHGVRHTMGAAFRIDDDHLVKMSFQRHSDQQAFSLKDEGFLNILHPHFQQFVRLCDVFDHQQADALGVTAMDYMNRPVWLVNASKHLVYCNQEAERWLSNGKLFCLKANTLTCLSSHQQPMLDIHIARLLKQHDTKKVPASRFLMQHHDQEETLWLMPMHVAETNQQLALLIGPKQTPNAIQISQQFTLSPRQGEVASLLAKGENMNTIASHMNLSVNTVRNQLTHCFRKMGINSQSELIQLVTSTFKMP